MTSSQLSRKLQNTNDHVHHFEISQQLLDTLSWKFVQTLKILCGWIWLTLSPLSCFLYPSASDSCSWRRLCGSGLFGDTWSCLRLWFCLPDCSQCNLTVLFCSVHMTSISCPSVLGWTWARPLLAFLQLLALSFTCSRFLGGLLICDLYYWALWIKWWLREKFIPLLDGLKVGGPTLLCFSGSSLWSFWWSLHFKSSAIIRWTSWFVQH